MKPNVSCWRTEAQKFNFGNTAKIEDRGEQNTPLLQFGIALIELSLSSSGASDGGAEGTPSCLLYIHPHGDHVSHYAFLWGEERKGGIR